MKATAHFWVVLTTLALITVTLMSVMNFPFNWVFYSTIVGQILIVLMVYKVLTDKYKTNKTFDDFYEDDPISGRPN
ncbi:hypothetical protein ACOCEA_02170 [Maribacter sp. CXY002]|uniref:hypothetical protein n=1 Tax=Maribacter luteocoastalis TaxID=3407671 RepID=UPI003B670F50